MMRACIATMQGGASLFTDTGTRARSSLRATRPRSQRFSSVSPPRAPDRRFGILEGNGYRPIEDEARRRKNKAREEDALERASETRRARGVGAYAKPDG